MKYAIIMSIVSRLHCSKSLTFHVELYQEKYLIRQVATSVMKKLKWQNFFVFYATKHIIKFFPSCDIWKLGRKTPNCHQRLFVVWKRRRQNITWSWRSSLHHHTFYDHDVELSCGLICLKKKRRKISEMINQNF